MSVDAADFHARVYTLVRLIPPGRVTSYGHVARLLDHPRHARLVGQALRFVHQDAGVPWQRVVSASGEISDRGDGGAGAQRQAERLALEGVEVIETQRTPPKWRVSLSTSAGFGWFPRSVDLDEAPPPYNERTSRAPSVDAHARPPVEERHRRVRDRSPPDEDDDDDGDETGAGRDGDSWAAQRRTRRRASSTRGRSEASTAAHGDGVDAVGTTETTGRPARPRRRPTARRRR